MSATRDTVWKNDVCEDESVEKVKRHIGIADFMIGLIDEVRRCSYSSALISLCPIYSVEVKNSVSTILTAIVVTQTDGSTTTCPRNSIPINSRSKSTGTD